MACVNIRATVDERVRDERRFPAVGSQGAGRGSATSQRALVYQRPLRRTRNQMMAATMATSASMIRMRMWSVPRLVTKELR